MLQPNQVGLQKVRKQPVEVFAVKVCDDNIQDILDLARDSDNLIVYVKSVGVRQFMSEIDRVVIRTREGEMTAYPDRHWIIKGVEGELYPIENDILMKSYEFVDNDTEGAR